MLLIVHVVERAALLVHYSIEQAGSMFYLAEDRAERLKSLGMSRDVAVKQLRE